MFNVEWELVGQKIFVRVGLQEKKQLFLGLRRISTFRSYKFYFNFPTLVGLWDK